MDLGRTTKERVLSDGYERLMNANIPEDKMWLSLSAVNVMPPATRRNRALAG